MGIEITVSYPLAFLAGLVSFLSPCVLPVVPGYVAFVSGVTLEELRDGDAWRARRKALIHSAVFVLGFTLVFMTMGLAATAAGQAVNRALPWINRAGGVILIFFGLYLAGVLRFPALSREIRVHLSSRPTGPLGSLLVGIAFGAGWTPCIGPILGSILLYSSLEATMVQGTMLLGTYALGLGIPFLAAAVGFNWFMAGTAKVRAWIMPLERVAGGLLAIVGLLMVTGQFATLSAFLGGLGQWIDLEMP